MTGPGHPEAFGSYRVIKRLGGGMQGETYLACDANGRQVAIKTLLLEQAATKKARRAMEREVAAIDGVSAGFVPEIIDRQLTCDRPFYVMEYLEGPTVDELLAAWAPLPKHRLQRFAVRLAVLVDALHCAGVAHGDLRGQNLIVTDGGFFAIDFGCAVLQGDDRRIYRRRRKDDLLRLGPVS